MIKIHHTKNGCAILFTILGPTGIAVDYTHTLAGAVRTITAPEFAQTLLRTEGKNPLWGGGISANLWRGADGIARRYDYAFDGFGRLTAADYSESGRPDGSLASGSPAADYSCSYAYDLNSNPTSIVRRGVTRFSNGIGGKRSLSLDLPTVSLPMKPVFGLIDDLSLVRDGNKLRRVDDGADSLPIYAGAPDFPDGVGDSVEYEYDPNGNLTRDDNRGYTAAYNLLNLPAHIKGDDGTIIRNYYDTSGTLLRRKVTTAFIAKTSESALSSTYSPSISKTVTDDYVGDLVFSESEYETSPLHGNSPTIRIVTPTGFVDTDGKVHSHVRDYQGNVRQVLDEEGNVEQSSDYYPYGMLMGESDLSATSASPNPFRFGGKHYLTAASLFLHDFAARFYDAALITFTSHDAITTNSYPTNPFLYCNADPINYIDPTGKDAEFAIEGTTITITANIFIYGDLATDKLAKIYQNKIDEVWGKVTSYTSNDGVEYSIKWNVSVSVMKGIKKDFNGVNNYMEVSGIEDSYVDFFNDGKIRSVGRDNRLIEDDCPMAHEFGHMLGLLDKYVRFNDGERYIPIFWEGNVMAERTYEKVVANECNMRLILEPVLMRYNSLLYKAVRYLFPTLGTPVYVNKDFRENE